MQLHAGRGLGIGQERVIVQEQGQFSPLPQLIPDGTTTNEGAGLGQEVSGEVGAVGG
jgi:hypothetical protein